VKRSEPIIRVMVSLEMLKVFFVAFVSPFDSLSASSSRRSESYGWQAGQATQGDTLKQRVSW